MIDELRRSQLITTFGIGSIVDFKDYSGVIKSPEVWPTELLLHLEENSRIDDPRLARFLRIDFFVTPPAKSAGGPRLPVTLFPRMLYCPNCKILKDARFWFPNGLRGQRALNCAECSKKGLRAKLLPSRFIVICPKGHVDDFPYEDWVHKYGDCSRKNEESYIPEFEYRAIGGGSSLEDIKIKCVRCQNTRSMTGALGGNFHKGFECRGNRPELYRSMANLESCGVTGENVRFVLRNASNVYFPRILSSLLIPPYSSYLSQRIQATSEFRTIMKLSGENTELFTATLEHYRKTWPVTFNVTQDRVNEAIETLFINRGEDPDVEQYKYDEYLAFTRSDRTEELNFRVQDVPSNSLSRFNIERLIKCTRLREVRVLSAYSRVGPSPSNLLHPLEAATEQELTGVSIRVVSLAKRQKPHWMPGVEVFGEGIFLVFDRNKLDVLEATEAAVRRTRLLNDNLTAYQAESGFVIQPTNARFVALHTLAHIILKRIAFESGYALASLKERIYCNVLHLDRPVNAMLIYTADTDSEGTLGGLSRMAEENRLRELVCDSLDDSAWCSADPVCRESRGQGMGSMNLAACHSCCLVPETCCEFGNRYLDRELMDIFFRNEKDS